VAFTVIMLLAPQNWFPVLAHLRIALVAGGTAVVCLLWDRWKHRKQVGLASEIVLCWALAAWALFTIPLSYWPGGSLNMLINVYLKAVVILCLLAGVITTAQRLRFIAITLVLCTLPLGITALKNYLTGNFIVGSGPSLERVLGYESGLAGNPNDLALMLNLVIPLAIAVFLSKPRPLIALLCVFAIALDVLGVILTMSRAGFLGLATIILVYFLKLVRRRGSDRRWAFALLIAGMLLLPLLPSSYVNRIVTMTDIDADPTGSAQQRWQGNVVAARFVMEHPIVGAGIGMDILALNAEGGPLWHQVHNVYLEYAVDLGVPGLILYLLLFYKVFKAASSSRRRAASLSGPRDLFLLDEGIEVSLVVFAAAGFFHPVAYQFYFYYIAGLALAARSVTDAAVRATKVVDDGHAETVALHAHGEGYRLAAGGIA
jgi:O-antigen ligase